MEKEVIAYTIKSPVKGSIIVGMTISLRRRLKEYNSGQSKSTKAYFLLDLIYSRDLAFRNERTEICKLNN
ncbi:MAG: hypothetical protein AB7E36_05495 [Salinivirgaceae bacterium]